MFTSRQMAVGGGVLALLGVVALAMGKKSLPYGLPGDPMPSGTEAFMYQLDGTLVTTMTFTQAIFQGGTWNYTVTYQGGASTVLTRATIMTILNHYHNDLGYAIKVVVPPGALTGAANPSIGMMRW